MVSISDTRKPGCLRKGFTLCVGLAFGLLAHGQTSWPDIRMEQGEGIRFEAKERSLSLNLSLRTFTQLTYDLDQDFHLTNHSEEIRRVHLVFTGHLFSPKLTYALLIGFAPNDHKPLPNGNSNLLRNAFLCYRPNPHWEFTFGQKKVQSNRAFIDLGLALSFVGRSIVSQQFNTDFDFGLFGEYHTTLGKQAPLKLKASITTGEGRNFGAADRSSGFAYTGRVELYPLGSFKHRGEQYEGDFERERQPRLMIGAGYSHNDRAVRLHGQLGNLMPEAETRTQGLYFVDAAFKWQGFAIEADFMGRHCTNPLFLSDPESFIFTGCGFNGQTSYLFRHNWNVALRNATLFPEQKIRSVIGYQRSNQTSLGIAKLLHGHHFKVQADASFTCRAQASQPYDRWQFRFAMEMDF